jgi:hypothetical protein
MSDNGSHVQPKVSRRKRALKADPQPSDSPVATSPTATRGDGGDDDDRPLVQSIVDERQRQLDALPLPASVVIAAVRAVMTEAKGEVLMPRKELRRRVEARLGGNVSLAEHKPIVYALALECDPNTEAETEAEGPKRRRHRTETVAAPSGNAATSAAEVAAPEQPSTNGAKKRTPRPKAVNNSKSTKASASGTTGLESAAGEVGASLAAAAGATPTAPAKKQPGRKPKAAVAAPTEAAPAAPAVAANLIPTKTLASKGEAETNTSQPIQAVKAVAPQADQMDKTAAVEQKPKRQQRKKPQTATAGDDDVAYSHVFSNSSAAHVAEAAHSLVADISSKSPDDVTFCRSALTAILSQLVEQDARLIAIEAALKTGQQNAVAAFMRNMTTAPTPRLP